MAPVAYSPRMRIYPPRPESAIPPSSLAQYKGFIAQYKYNDVRTLVRFIPTGKVELLNRHLQPHIFYSLSRKMQTCLRALPLRKDRYHILDGGVLNRIGGIRDRIVLWDILVHDSRYLIGTPLMRRYEILREICGDPETPESETGRKIALKVNRCLWLAPIFRENFDKHFRDALDLDILEGIILKAPNSCLERAYGERNNGNWQIRVRKPHPNYPF